MPIEKIRSIGEEVRAYRDARFQTYERGIVKAIEEIVKRRYLVEFSDGERIWQREEGVGNAN